MLVKNRNGDFNVPFATRSKDDLLGNALVKMKDTFKNLQKIIGKRGQLRLMQRSKGHFYKSPLPKWIFNSQRWSSGSDDAAGAHDGYKGGISANDH